MQVQLWSKLLPVQETLRMFNEGAEAEDPPKPSIEERYRVEFDRCAHYAPWHLPPAWNRPVAWL